LPNSQLPLNLLTNGYMSSISLPTHVAANAIAATNVTAATFVGAGTGLTNIPVSNVNGLGSLATASTISSNNLSGQINVGQVFGALTGSSLPANVLTNGYTNAISLPTSVSANAITATNVTAAAFVGDGSGLTNLPSSSINGLGSLATASSISSNNISGQINVSQLFGALPGSQLPANVLTNGFTDSVVLSGSLTVDAITQTDASQTNVFAGPIIATNLIPLQNGYVPYANLNPVIYASSLQWTNGLTGPTNSPPANTNVIVAWLNFTNNGVTYKMPLYQ
jgi:hypothetical protein